MVQWIRPWTLNHEVLGSYPLVTAVAPFGKAFNLFASPSEGPFIYVLGTDTRCICSRNKFSVHMRSDYEITELFSVP